MVKKRKPNQKLQRWIDARKRYHLSHAQVQMARELGMNPMKLGKLDNHEQELWKMPLRAYIEHLYLKRFGRPSPENITSIEERLRLAQEKKEAQRASKRQLSFATPIATPGDEANGRIPTLDVAVVRKNSIQRFSAHCNIVTL